MKRYLKALKTSTYPLIAACLVGCSPGFEVSSATNVSSETEASLLDISPDEAEKILSIGAWSHLLPSVSESSGFEYHDITIKTPYERILKPIAKQLELRVPKICPSLGYGDASAAYGAQEYACGTPQANQWKTLLDLDIDEIADDQGGTQYRVPAFKTQLLLGRSNRSLPYTIKSLDTNQNVFRQSSLIPGRDIAIRFRPAGDQLGVDACFFLPGTTLSSPAQTLKVSGSKKVLGVRVKASTDVEIKFGEMRFDGVRNCVTAVFSLDATTGTPKIQSTEMGDAQLVGTVLTGTSIRLKDWWARFFDSMARLFGVNIRKNLIVKAQAEVADLSDAESANGQWIAKIGKRVLGDRHIEELNKLIQNELNGKSLPFAAGDVKTILKRNCQVLSLIDNELSAVMLPTFCEAVVDRFEFHLSPFEKSEVSEANGCYGSYAFVHETKDSKGNAKWWAENCVVNSRLIIGVPKVKELAVLKFVLKKVSRVIKESDLPITLAAKLKDQGVTIDSALKRVEEAIASGNAPRTLAELEALF